MNLQTRVINILSKPAQEWPVIASEATDVAALYKEYIMLLAAIPAICGFLGMMLIGVTAHGQWFGRFDSWICALSGRNFSRCLYRGQAGSQFSVQWRNCSGFEDGGFRFDSVLDSRRVAADSPAGCIGVAGGPLWRLPLLSWPAFCDEDASRQSDSLHGGFCDRDYCDLRGHSFNLWSLHGCFTTCVLRAYGNRGGRAPWNRLTALHRDSVPNPLHLLLRLSHGQRIFLLLSGVIRS